MRKNSLLFLIATLLLALPLRMAAESAISVLGKDFAFPNHVEGLPGHLSDFANLQINFFTSSDGVKLAYWEAGSGKPLIFVPAWSANGANYINVLYLLSKHYHVYVLDERNQGLSQKVDFGNRIARNSMDLHEFSEHLGLKSASYCGWSMGVSVLYGLIDLYGTGGIEKLILIDEPPSILSRPGMTPSERLESGALAGTLEGVSAVLAAHTGVSLNDRYNAMDSPAYANSEAFARAMVPVDYAAANRVMYDHAHQDWRDVIRHKITVPTAIFTGEYSANVPSQRWMQSVIPGARLYVYSKAEQGDHFLALKNPFKFTDDLRTFIDQPASKPATAVPSTTRKLLLQTRVAWNSSLYGPYPSGDAMPSVVEIHVIAHSELPWHSHSVPSFAYLVSGDFTVEDRDGNSRHYMTGDVIAETVHTEHHGKTGDQDATFVVFYAATDQTHE